MGGRTTNKDLQSQQFFRADAFQIKMLCHTAHTRFILMLAIGTMPDHIHIFIGYDVNQLIPELVEEIKISSNAWIKARRLSKFKFEWQRGYGAFTHARSQLNQVVKYVLTQEAHHHKSTFREEYLEILRRNDIEFKDEYVFEFFDGIADWE